jgi:hypothetical protein
MDKITKFQDIIIDFIIAYEAQYNDTGDVKRRLLFDKTNNSFQLLSAGWRNNHYIFGPIFHFDIINEKICIQCNNTEREIVDEFMEKGIDRQDLVLGFLSPFARKFSGFAVA